ncbi:MAG TPA: TIGR04282 family arsenosugar biosynthesis glycosyltransferase [Candidatus Acidoferrales bacterium]|nr:TIGR04282 family arsenosugar biosynthesis glycosyltransferase [Candidatus Acidoferrales bacterium]
MLRDSALVVFAKLPVAGRVKTRLLGALSPSQAAQVHRACLRDTVALLDAVPACSRWLMVAGSDEEARALAREMKLGAGWNAYAQFGRDLGARLERAMGRLFAMGMRRVVVVGTDAPWIGVQKLRQALRWLEADDVVIGPAADGGYYLVGARRPVEEIFRGIPWGSSQVMAATRRTLEKLRIRFRLLGRDFDLDRPADLARAAEMLRASPHRAPALAAWLAKHRKG